MNDLEKEAKFIARKIWHYIYVRVDPDFITDLVIERVDSWQDESERPPLSMIAFGMAWAMNQDFDNTYITYTLRESMRNVRDYYWNT